MRQVREITPARAARIASGRSVAEIARRLCVSEESVRSADRLGGRPAHYLAQRLARVYGCRIDLFLQNGSKPANATGNNGSRARTNSTKSTNSRSHKTMTA